MLPRFSAWVAWITLISSPLMAFAEDGNVEGYDVKKVNHEFLDAAGYATDEIGDLPAKARYQATLERSGKYDAVRFVIHWRVPSGNIPNVTIKLQVRGMIPKLEHESVETLTKEYPKSPSFSGWVNLDIRDAQLKRLGRIMAWKVTILQDGKPMASRKSFTWDDSFLASQPQPQQETQAAPPAQQPNHETK